MHPQMHILQPVKLKPFNFCRDSEEEIDEKHRLTSEMRTTVKETAVPGWAKRDVPESFLIMKGEN